jgi:molecular chaperone GrpE
MAPERTDTRDAPRPAAASEAAAAAAAAATDAAAGGSTPAAPASDDREDYSAAAPRDPHAAGTGETSFADAEAPPAPLVEAQVPPSQGDPAAAAQARAAEYLALAQRTQADFENFRKRAARDAAQAADRGVRKLAKELLPALDHLDLALRAGEEHGGGELLKGFQLVQEELVSALGRVGIQPFSPRGERFDPAEHEAMAAQPAEGAESGTVIEVYQQGYRINGAVLRPARVVVAA